MLSVSYSFLSFLYCCINVIYQRVPGVAYTGNMGQFKNNSIFGDILAKLGMGIRTIVRYWA